MLSSTNLSKRTLLSALGPAAGVVAACLVFPSVALAQDECASATTANVGANAFSTAAASASANPPSDAACSDTYLAWLATQQDVWFVYSPGSAGVLTLTTCDAASYDTSMAVYSGTCGSLTQIACNGDDLTPEGSCQQYYSNIENLFVDGTSSIYIRIGGYNGAVGTGNLTLSFTPVAYETCVTNTTDSCAEVHANPGCMDTKCCETVCAAYPPCCETTWEQLCVDLAIDSCGYFVYECPGANAGGNDCFPNATLITADGNSGSWNNAAYTNDGPFINDCYNSAENDGIAHHNRWWYFTAAANGFVTISNCDTGTYDSKIGAFHIVGGWSGYDPNNLINDWIACNEDGADCDAFTSLLTFAVEVGETYAFTVGSYLGEVGDTTVSWDLPEPCTLPATGGSEGEACGDSTNPGCSEDLTTIMVTDISVGTTYSGSFWADGDFRDVDWFRFSVGADSQVTVSLWSASQTVLFIFGGDPCTGLTQLAEGGQTACPMTATACLNPGVYYIGVAIDDFNGTPCDTAPFNAYALKVEAAPATCPIVLGTACTNPGPQDVTVNAGNATNLGIIACAYAVTTGTPGTGGTAENSWARVYTPAQIPGGELHCISFGAWHTWWNGTGYAAADRLDPGFLRLYRDLDNGAPVNPGVDLELIQEWSLMVPGGAFIGTITLDTPLCLDEETNNLVVVYYCPTTLPVATGYQMRAGGNNAGPTSQTYRKLECAETQFVLYASINNWYVSLNGDFTSCEAPCDADLNDDGIVDGADLGAVLGAWGVGGGFGPADFNDDGIVDGADLGFVLGAWGPCP